VRTLLGQPTPCVGRKQELASLRATLEECASEPAARLVLITAPSGLGKSRIRHEMVREVIREGRWDVWLARGDSLTAGSALAMLGQALRSTLGLASSSRGPGAASVLEARVARSVSPTEVRRVSEFLGELIGIPFEDDATLQLRAARKDAHLMGDQMRRAFEDFVGAECEKRPVLLVLEDLQWCDLPTVSFVDSALRNLHDRPFMVLALGRPEVASVFPHLWEGRPMTAMQLSPLPRKAAERLLVTVLGEAVDADMVASLVTRAAGNVFFLEELIRAVAEGKKDRLPETVLATAHHRLEALDGEQRRTLRAASVFGQSFWDQGVAVLMGEAQAQVDGMRARLDDLARRELVTARKDSRVRDASEYVFRHAIVEEAVYGTLTDRDRILGHRLAAEWLERAGEGDATALAGHWERAEEPARASGHHLRAAQQALEAHDHKAALFAADRAIVCGAEGEALGEARLLQAEAYRWRGQFEEAERAGFEALRALPAPIPRRYAVIALLMTATGQLGHAERMKALLDELATHPGATGLGYRVVATARGAAQLLSGGRLDDAAPVLEWLRAHAGAVTGEDPMAEGALEVAHAMQALVSGDPSAYLERSNDAVRAFDRAGDRRSSCIQLVNVGYAYMELGRFVEAEDVLRDAMDRARRMGLENAYADAGQNLGYVVAMRGRTTEGAALESASVESFVAQKLPRMEAGGRAYLSLILSIAGDPEGAETQAARAVEIARSLPPTRAWALSVLARARLARKDVAGALEAATDAMNILTPLGGVEAGEALIRLTHAEALEAAGRREEAVVAIRAAKERLLARGAAISHVELRRSFLELVPENARTLELARVG
jgi:eukaryotic-like serine/threonine-protein kinase